MRRSEHWHLCEWLEFGQRCFGLRDEVSDFIRDFPDTRFLTPATINAWIKVHDRLARAMFDVENRFVEQHPEHVSLAIRLVHGSGGTIWVPCRGRVPATAPLLAVPRWLAIGRRARAIRDDLFRLSGDYLRVVPKQRGRRFEAARRALVVARGHLESLAAKQYPDWRGATAAFFGDREVTPEAGK